MAATRRLLAVLIIIGVFLSLLPIQHAVAAAPQVVYAPVASSSKVLVSDLNGNIITSFTTPSPSRMAVPSPDGGMVYVACNNGVYAYRSSDYTLAWSITGTYNYAGSKLAINPTGTMLYVSLCYEGKVLAINTQTRSVTAITVGSQPDRLCITPDGSKVYVPNYASNTVSVISTSSNTVTKTISVGTQPTMCAARPTGGDVWVLNYGSATVSVISTSTDSVLYTYDVGMSAPNGLAWSSVGSKVYITSTNSPYLIVMDTGVGTSSYPSAQPYYCVAYGSSGYVYAVSTTGTLDIWPSSPNSRIASVSGYAGAVDQITIGPGSSYTPPAPQVTTFTFHTDYTDYTQGLLVSVYNEAGQLVASNSTDSLGRASFILTPGRPYTVTYTNTINLLSTAQYEGTATPSYNTLCNVVPGDTAHSRSGWSSLKVAWNGTASDAFVLYNLLTGLSPNTEYTLEVWVYAESNIYLQANTININEWSGQYRKIAPVGSGLVSIPANTWTRLQGSGTTPPDWSSSNVIVLRPAKDSSGALVTTPVWYDTLMVYKSVSSPISGSFSITPSEYNYYVDVRSGAVVPESMRPGVQQPVDVNVYVVNWFNPVRDASISIYAGSTLVSSGVTDGTGNYYFRGYQNKQYTCNVTYGGKVYTQTFSPPYYQFNIFSFDWGGLVSPPPTLNSGTGDRLRDTHTSMTATLQDTTGIINMSYTDDTQTTSSVVFKVYRLDAGTISLVDSKSYTSSTATASFTIPNANGGDYVANITASNVYGVYTAGSWSIHFAGPRLVIPVLGASSDLYPWISFAVCILCGALFSVKDAHLAGLGVMAPAWLFYYAGWLPPVAGSILGTGALLGILTFLSILLVMKKRQDPYE